MDFLYFYAAVVGLGFQIKEISTYSIEDESKLQSDLLSGYNVNVRPSDRISIRCTLNIRNLLSLNIVEQTLAVTGELGVVWHDHRLSWNESEYGNVSNIYYKYDQIWRPTLVLQNSVTGIEVMGDNGNQRSIPMSVVSGGRVFWLAPAYFVSYCSVEVSKFPFDTQTCELLISGWLYTKDVLELSTFNEVGFERFEENGEYQVIRSYSRVDSFTLYSQSVETLVYGIELRRKYSYYLLNIVLPVFFMQLLGLVVFVVPAESGEKLTFSLTLLLSLTVMMTLVAEKIPTTSLQIFLNTSIYMLGGTIISILELITTVIVLRFKYYSKEGANMTNKMQTLAAVLASLTCMKECEVQRISQSNKVQQQKQSKLATIVDIAKEDEIDNTASERTKPNEINSKYERIYTYEDISKMFDKASLLFFSVLTFIFSLTLLLMILI